MIFVERLYEIKCVMLLIFHLLHGELVILEVTAFVYFDYGDEHEITLLTTLALY